MTFRVTSHRNYLSEYTQRRGLSYQEREALHRETNRRTRIYVHPERETVLENLENRRNRPWQEWRKSAVPVALAALGLPSDTRVSWSQKAGCSCGCSPGFIVKEHWGHDVWLCDSPDPVHADRNPAYDGPMGVLEGYGE